MLTKRGEASELLHGVLILQSPRDFIASEGRKRKGSELLQVESSARRHRRILLFQDFRQNVGVQQGERHGLLGRTSEVGTIQNDLIQLRQFSVRQALENSAP